MVLPLLGEALDFLGMFLACNVILAGRNLIS